MPDEKYSWPAAEKRKHIGQRMSRVDGPVKSSGRARYTYDYNPKDLLYGAMVGCPHPHAKVVSVKSGTFRPHYDVDPGKRASTEALLRGVLQATHAPTFFARLGGWWRVVRAVLKGK